MTPSRQRAVIFGLILVGLVVAGFFGWRTLHAFRQFRGYSPPPPLSAPEIHRVETDVELIRDWMTIPFIAKMYDVPAEILFDAVDVSPRDNQNESLKEINRRYYPEARGVIMQRIKAAIRAYQAQEAPDGDLDSSIPPIKPIGPTPP